MSDRNDTELDEIFSTIEAPVSAAGDLPVAEHMSIPAEPVPAVEPEAAGEPAPARPVEAPKPNITPEQSAAPDYSRYYSSGYTYTGSTGNASTSSAGAARPAQAAADAARTGYTYTGGTPGFTGVRRTAEKAPKKKSIGWGALIAVALCCSLLGSIFGSAGTWLVAKQWNAAMEAAKDAKQEEAPAAEAAVPEEKPTVTINYAGSSKPNSAETVTLGSGMSAADVYAANVNSTVGITTSITTTNYFGMTTTGAASGSGFILTDNGYIITNYHVIEDANAITVTTYDDTAYEAVLVGYDEDNDIAVLKVDATDLQPVIIGSSDSLRVGDQVAAIGNPLGELTFSLTCGVVSALDRKITLSSGTTMNLLQTDCAINSGNSGGALFNMNGEVIGITNAKYSSSGYSSSASIDNVGFAIPISQVMPLIQSIMEKGYVSKAYLGVSVSNVSEDVQAFGYPAGAIIRSVVAGSPAEKAGLAVQDIVTSINGNEVTDSEFFADFIGSCQAGDTVTLEIYRDGETLTITAVLGEKAVEQSTSSSSQSSSGNSGNGNGGYGYGYGGGNGGYGYGYGNGSGGYGYGNGWPFSWGG